MPRTSKATKTTTSAAKKAQKTTKSKAPAKPAARGVGKKLCEVRQFADGSVCICIGREKFAISTVQGKLVASHENCLRKDENAAFLEMSPLQDLLERLSNKNSPLWKAAQELSK